jgi:hypothetical protein
VKGRFANADDARVFYRQVEERVSAIPGVVSVALASTVPLEGWSDGMPLTISRRTAFAPRSSPPSAPSRCCSPRSASTA